MAAMIHPKAMGGEALTNGGMVALSPKGNVSSP